MELYFEEEDIDAFVTKLQQDPTISYVHPLQEHPWGQHAIRLCDPDVHILEIGENMDKVYQRFRKKGMGQEEIAK